MHKILIVLAEQSTYHDIRAVDLVMQVKENWEWMISIYFEIQTRFQKAKLISLNKS